MALKLKRKNGQHKKRFETSEAKLHCSWHFLFFLTESKGSSTKGIHEWKFFESVLQKFILVLCSPNNTYIKFQHD